MLFLSGALAGASLLALAAAAPDDDPQRREILVVGERKADTPATSVSLDAETIATTVNAIAVEDTLKYLPSLILRKRSIGDTQAVLATRTSGVGASARSLVYADGALLSALIGNNNSTAAPRWGLVSPQEIARVDVLYGPFAAAYPGNAMGAVVTITTRTPERLEATATAAVNVQDHQLYGTDAHYPTYQLGATLGDRFGPLALFAAYERVHAKAQPLLYVTAPRPMAASTAGTPATGGFDTLNRTGAPIRVLGASGIPDQRQQRFKLKAALDLGATRLTYVGGLFLNAADATVQSYVSTAAGPGYAGTFNLDGRAYTLAASAFSGGFYRFTERHWSHSLSATGTIGQVEWQAVATGYRYAEDEQRTPTTALPAAEAGGAGTITRLDGTGWLTLDGRLAWRPSGAHRISLGAHVDRYTLQSDRFLTADWRSGTPGALDLRARGRTRTAALWAEEQWRPSDTLTLTIGGRYEWWRADHGENVSRAPAIATVQPVVEADRFSPKATLAWTGFGRGMTLRASYGEAWRFPTVGELYQLVTAPVPAIPDPNLRPEQVRSWELALERRGARDSLRVALFGEAVRDALISQSGTLPGTTALATFVQNVERTRAHGVEVAGALTAGTVELTGSVTYADAVTRANAALPASVGKTLPSVPRWKATLVATWRPTPLLALTAAGRYASRMYGTLDNSDPVAFTYQGFGSYLVADLRAELKAGERITLGLGVDNVGDRRYFLFHPFPQRSFHADVKWRL